MPITWRDAVDFTPFQANIDFVKKTEFCIRKQITTDMRYEKPFHCEMKYIKNISGSLSDERLSFLDGKRLSDVDIFIESNATVRKVRRIIEKRVCQEYWRTRSGKGSNGDRQRMRRHVSNQFKNIYGAVPSGFRYCA